MPAPVSPDSAVPRKPDDIPILTTDRLCLRGWAEKDFAPYLALATDPDRMRFVGSGAMTEQEARDEFQAMRDQWRARGFGVFVIADLHDDRSLGFTGLWESPLLEEPELCWSLFPGCDGAGYASEGAALVRDWAFLEKGRGPLMSLVHPENHPSRRLAVRLGASIEGESTWLGSPRLVYRHTLPT